MSLRPHRRTMVVWSSSSGRTARHGVQQTARSARTGRIRWWLRTGALLAIIGMMRLARTAAKYPRPALSLAGTVITVAGISLRSEPLLISGFVVLMLAMFMPSDPASVPARPCSARLWSLPLTPFALSSRRLPPSDWR
jgi:hypothetical protein